ncbi:MFS polyamine transporter [Trametes versicolor FP-101664 SS1]|uniref:MFS polyamine transporter n=1 Tax=Trametes versicolor (strain FP-101664) TaxID=717944 RepID=UPI000462303A|nr:MFS polyamine transporter [Trametes versicolor FP-101664 SS1]EIW62246.1 MFS polyamine transporter [Trametes versicolor FP-101664 SS1]
MASPSTGNLDEGQVPQAEDGAEKTGDISTSGSEAPSVLIVDWEGPNDPANPKNWSAGQKWAITLVVSSYAFLSPLSSSMMAPAANDIAHDLGETNKTVIALFTSIYVAAYALGPLTMGPLCELYGRARILQLSNLFYFAWNFGCGFARNPAELIVFRFLSGWGGSAAPSIGGGVLGDVWSPEQRGQAMTMYTLAPLLGPCIGPICGAWIAERSSWRWVFWSTSIACVLVQAVGLFYLKETYAPVLLERKAKHIREGMRDAEKGPPQEVRTIFDSPDREWHNVVRKTLIRPFALSIQEPIIQVFAVYLSFVYGTLYIFLTTIPSIFEGVYREPVGIAGLHYLALGLGSVVAAQLSGRLIDMSYKRLTAHYNGVGKPEYRLPALVPGSILLPIGLFITGWTARADVHWIAPDIGIALVGGGTIFIFQGIMTYVLDAFAVYAASALAALAFFRSIAGFCFPLFAPAMYSALGYGKGDTILACFAIAVGVPAPYLFWTYGERIRNASRYAKK